MKKDWLRETNIVDFSQIRPGVKAAIEKEFNAMGEKLDFLYIIETVSTSLKKSIFAGKPKTIYSALLVTTQWLVQAIERSDQKTGPFVIFHYLDKMQLSYRTVEMAHKLGFEDFGINIFSQTKWNLKGADYFIGLENCAATIQFIETLKTAISNENQ